MKKNVFFYSIPSFIIVLLPALLITGPFLADLGVSLVAILFLINSIKNNLKKYFDNFYFKFFILFCLLLIISSLLSDNILKSLKNSLFYFRFGIFSLCFWYLLDHDQKIIKKIFFSILICFFCLLIDGYTQYIFGKNLFGYPLYNEYRVSSFFGSELILGSYLARFFPILFALFIFLHNLNKNKLIFFLVTIIFILSEGLIVLSGERLALFFMNLSAIFMIIMLKEFKTYRFWTYIVSLILIISLMNISPNTKNRIIDNTIKDFTHDTFKNNKQQDDKLYIFSKTHTELYISAYVIFLNNKYFGVGPRQFRNKCDTYIILEYSCETHPHNTYLELLSEAGIFAFLIVITLFASICYLSIKHLIFKIFKSKKIIFNDVEVCLVASLFISLWPFSPNGSFFNNWMSIVYYFPVGLLLWQRFKKEQQKSE